MLDVHRPVPGPRHGHQQIRLSDPAAARIGGSLLLTMTVLRPSSRPPSPPHASAVRVGHHAGIGVQRCQPREDLGLELAARRARRVSTRDTGSGMHGRIRSHCARTGHCLAR